MIGMNKELPISPMKKLKILSENQNLHNKVGTESSEYVTKYDTTSANDLKVKMSNIKPQEQIVENEVEPLLQETVDQYVIFPINHHDMWEMYKKLVENFWSTTENIENLEKLHLNENEIKFLKTVCSFYITLDNNCGIVNENFAEEFSKLIKVTEAKFYYGHQLFVQNIHFEMYNKLFETLAKSETERNQLCFEMEAKASVQKKREWVKKWSDENVPFSEKLVASVCLHGLFFTTINLIQLWMKKRSTPETATHELIDVIDKMVIDQDSHRDFSCLMIQHLRNKPTPDFIQNLIEEATQIEKTFLYEAIPFALLDLTVKDVVQTLDKRATILKLKLLKAFDTTSKIKSVPSEKELGSENKATIPAGAAAAAAPVIDKNIRFDEDF